MPSIKAPTPVCILLAVLAAIVVVPVAAAAVARVRPVAAFGTTFSHRELRVRGLDWRKALDAMDDLGLKFVRIGVYWSEVEPEEGRFDFSEMDDLLARLERKGIKALVTVGMKAPRWPEYYIPGWAAPASHGDKYAEPSKDADLRRRTLNFIGTAVRHLSSSPAIIAWQVENEPMDRSGERHWFIGADFLKEEADAIRRNDGRRRPLIVNCWSDDQMQSSKPWRQDGAYAVKNALSIGDILGLDVYPRVGGEQKNYARRSIALPTRYMSWARSRSRPAWIIESQAEPWPPSDYDAGAMRWLVDRHVEQGYQVILLWGFEWWYERHLKGEDDMWNAVRELATGRPPEAAADKSAAD